MILSNLVTIPLMISLSLGGGVSYSPYFDILKPPSPFKISRIIASDTPWETDEILAAKSEAPKPPKCKDNEVLEEMKCVPKPEEKVLVNEKSLTSLENVKKNEQNYNENAKSEKLYTLENFMFNGVVNWEGFKFTYYQESVLPGQGLSIPGRHINKDGYVSDKDGYIVLAAPFGIEHGNIYPTPFGYMGKVYDSCASCSTSPMWLDVYIK